MKVAVVDLGTNSARLLLAGVEGGRVRDVVRCRETFQREILTAVCHRVQCGQRPRLGRILCGVLQ